MAEECAKLNARLQALKAERADAVVYDPRGKPHKTAAWSKINQEIKSVSQQLAACLEEPVPPTPMALSVSDISCFAQNDAAPLLDTENDEPYVLVYSLDYPAIEAIEQLFPIPDLSKLVPHPRVTLVGPWLGITADGTSHSAPSNVIWGLSGKAALLNDPDDALFLVAVLENDYADVDAVRTSLELIMGASLANHLSSIGNRADFADRMRQAMEGAIPYAKAAVPDPDDQIGSVRQLVLTRSTIGRAYHLGSSKIPLMFEGDDASYVVTFTLSS